MIEKIRAAITVLQKGEELTHAESWKSRQNVSNLVVALLGAVVVFLPPSLQLAPDDLATLGSAVAVIAGLCNAYLTTATSARVGVQTGRDGTADKSPDPDITA